MKKIAIVVQRYGLEVNGGAEYHCRILAEKLNSIYQLEVLTSCAKDYTTWRNEYDSGLSEINGVKIRRFTTAQDRNKKNSQAIERRLRKKTFLQKTLRFLGVLQTAENLLKDRNANSTKDLDINSHCSIYCTYYKHGIFVKSGGNAIQTAQHMNTQTNRKIRVGDKVTFDNDKLEAFKADTNRDNKEIQEYRKLVLAGIDQVGIVKELGVALTTVSYSDGWDLPIPTKYLIILSEV
ncbi:MAG: hypothetical protein EOO43_27220 [Flavobacterium sp.]|nr:MAG: hypothetical protein EOO43_27220 [Flavobacterium sp.]